jgi:hypothetical protein
MTMLLSVAWAAPEAKKAAVSRLLNSLVVVIFVSSVFVSLLK